MIHHPVIKAGFDIVSIVVIVGTFIDYLPKIAAGVSALWYTYLIYDKYKSRNK